MILRLLNAQGMVGIAVSLSLAILLTLSKIETHHWRKQSAAFEQRYRDEQATLAATTANYRAAAETARAADIANAARVTAEQHAITERTADAYEARLTAARAAAADIDAGRVRLDAQVGTDPGARRSPSMPGLPAGPARAAQAAEQDRLPPPDRLTATEQAIQLDELIKWVRAQSQVQPGTDAVSRP